MKIPFSKNYLKALAESLLQVSPPPPGTPEYDIFWKNRPEIKKIANRYQSHTLFSKEKYDELLNRAELSLDKYQKQMPWWYVGSLLLLLGGESSSFAAYLGTIIWGDLVTPNTLVWVIVLGVIILGITAFKFIRSAALEARAAQHKGKMKQWLNGDPASVKKAEEALNLMSGYYTSPYEKNKWNARIMLFIFLTMFFLGVGIMRGFEIRSTNISTSQQFSGTMARAYRKGFSSEEVDLPESETNGTVDEGSETSDPPESDNSTSYSPVLVSLILSIVILGTAILVFFDLTHRVKLVLDEEEWQIIKNRPTETIFESHQNSDVTRRQQAFLAEIVLLENIFNHCVATTNPSLLNKYPPLATINANDFGVN